MASYVPTQGATHRNPELWQSSGRSRFDTLHDYSHSNGIGEQVGGLFGSDRKSSLPMYKDKPYAYPGSRRRNPFLRNRKAVIFVLVALAGASWWFGVLSPLSWFTSEEKGSPQKSRTSWLGGKTSIARWDEQAEKVKEVFKSSWAGYEQHAWGMCRVWLPG
jgi:endoplasmic reticulum Man9GlcNAc2 1,2-alpha-mannosidase